MYSIPHSSTSKYRSSSRRLYTPLDSSHSHKTIKTDLSKYDELIKKARETINKCNNNSNISNYSRSKSRLRGNNISSTSHILSTRNIPENYSYLTKRLTTSSRESKDDIHYELSRTQENDIEEYYKSLFKKMRNDSNIQNEKIFKLESKNKQNELDLMDNEREKDRLKDKVKTLENKLNETNILYEDLKK